MRGEPLTLDGCAPTPLASYLKALGVLRLISSPANHVSGKAADAQARGWWEDERFHLRTTLSREELLRFFLDDYAPSTIIAPWNGGSGFYPKDNRDGFDPLLESDVAKRFSHYSSAVRKASQAVAYLALAKRPDGDAKTKLVALLRATLSDEALPWIDAVLALSGSSIAYPELLGTGGNDGRLDFTNNFARRMVSRKKPLGLFDASTGKPSPEAAGLLEGALFATSVGGLRDDAVGQFAPGAAGGPNATTGYKSGSESNPWDFVLMLEGSAAFAGTATRRHQRAAGSGSTTRSGASFPFTVRTVGAGWGGVEASDENDARAEFWAPLWIRPTRYSEVDSLLGEGRAVLNSRSAKDGLDFARAVASLGVSRGFHEFERFGFLMRAGRSYLAAPLGRRPAAASRGASLIADLDVRDWLDKVRWAGRKDAESSGQARQAVKRLEDALFGLMAPDASSVETERALAALGGVVGWLAVSPDGRQDVGTPPPILSRTWIKQADDYSAEFRVAAALAGIGLPKLESAGDATSEPALDIVGEAPSASDAAPLPETTVSDMEHRSKVAPPMAAHLAPIDEKSFLYRKRLSNGLYRERLSKRRAWADGGLPPTMVWGAGGLVSNLIAVLERRLVEASIRGLKDKPLSSASFARLADVAKFLSGDFDDARCAALLAGLVWARPAWFRSKSTNGEHGNYSAIPFAYAALKPVFTPNADLHGAGALHGEAKLPVPPGLVARLRAGGNSRDGRAADAAVRTALSRASASGLVSPFDPARSRSGGVGASSGHLGAGVAADRLAAALLVPISNMGLKALLKRAFPGTLPENDTQTTEE